MTELETYFYSLLFVYKECTQIPVSAKSDNGRQFSYVMVLAAASLLGPVQGELIGFLSSTSLLGSDYKSVLLTDRSFPHLTEQCSWLHITHILSSIKIYT